MTSPDNAVRAALIYGRDLGVVRDRGHQLAAKVAKDPDDPFDVAQLTDGDPLAFLSGRVVEGGRTVDSLPILSRRARQVLDLVSADAHAELRRVIGVAKERFGLDALIALADDGRSHDVHVIMGTT